MKYINLIPLELQSENKGGRSQPITSYKKLWGYILVCAVGGVIFFCGIMLAQHHYNNFNKYKTNVITKPETSTLLTQKTTTGKISGLQSNKFDAKVAKEVDAQLKEVDVATPKNEIILSPKTKQSASGNKLVLLTEEALKSKYAKGNRLDKAPAKRKIETTPQNKRAIENYKQAPYTDNSIDYNQAEEKGNTYTLCLGTFESQKKASALIKELKKKKIEPHQRTSYLSKYVHTVYVARAPSMKDAMRFAQKLENDGLNAFIKIRSEDVYWVGIKSFSSRIKALKLAKEIKKRGYNPQILGEQSVLTVYQVNFGHYKEYRQAKFMQHKLGEKGYHIASIIRE